ncbi:MAG TPA: lipase maturation factor family protein [Chloroflexota bacterium]|nr:lipase maturation factor family protein [Chloroflexota bacterium]
MEWLQAPDYWLTRLVFERALALIYLVAFAVAINQFRPLLGERGLLPVPYFLRLAGFRQAPSLFHLHYSDRFLAALSWTGLILSAAVAVGVPDIAPPWVSIPVWLILWVIYLSIVNVGQIFYAFGWESLLLEVGLLAAFFGDGRPAPPLLVIFLLRWVLFRLEFGAGLIKLRGDPCWRDLTCLNYHHETQPMPNPLSWYFHHLPRSVHKLEVLGNHFAQLVVPFGLFAPQPVASLAGAIIILSQAWLVASGNFSWLNFMAILLALTTFDDHVLGHVLPVTPASLAPLPLWWQILSVALTLMVVVLSYWPVRNMLSRRQRMNFSFNRYHFVNSYGAFGSITKVRYEIILEGTGAELPLPDADWKAYEFKGKPGDPHRRPPQIAPYHLRLDWLMWFAAMASPFEHPWLLTFVEKLLANDRPTLKLLRHNPFPDRPPRFIRAQFYRYRFTTGQERRGTGAWWDRTLVAEYLPPLRLEGPVTQPTDQP